MDRHNILSTHPIQIVDVGIKSAHNFDVWLLLLLYRNPKYIIYNGL